MATRARAQDGSSTIISGIDLREIARYVEQIGDELILEWPEWIKALAEKGKLTFRKIDFC